MSNPCPPLLNAKDPAPITQKAGKSALLFTGPHNGKAVPHCLSPCLGTCKEWFKTAHEASDVHMDEMFEHLQTHFTDANFLAGCYSRLVCDLNALPDYAVRDRSSEHDHLKIPQNQPECCCMSERLRRLEAIYTPYHDAKKALVNTIRKTHGHILVLDMHSFSPTWRGNAREVEIGTIRSEKTPLSRAFEEFLKTQNEYRFISGQPYRVAERPSNAAPMVTESLDLQYLGIEIRSDLIDTPEKREEITVFLEKCITHLMTHPQKDDITKNRSLTLETTPQPANISWSI